MFLYQELKSIVTMAGQIVLSHFDTKVQVSFKESSGPVTNVDIIVEDFLKKHLSDLIPSSGFIAEESLPVLDKEYTWIIDPLDGTRNFIRGVPLFCISIALMHKNRAMLSVIYLPITGDFFYAEKSKGAWFNDNRLIRGCQDIESLMIVSSIEVIGQCYQAQLFQSLEKGVKFRVSGSIAFDLALTAKGCHNVAIFKNLAPWDQVAGTLLIEEAGGMVLDSFSSTFLSSNQILMAGDEDLCLNFFKNLKKSEN